MTYIDKLASAIHNDVLSGLLGYHTNFSLSMELLADEIVLQRLLVIKEYQLKGVLPIRDLMLTITCIPVDCKDLERCSRSCGTDKKIGGKSMAHFEIPQIINDYGLSAIEYIGSPDLQHPFRIQNGITNWRYSKYSTRGKDKPYVYIDTTPNENNMYDCYIFNAPLIKRVTVIAIFKDPRLFCDLPLDSGACGVRESSNTTWIDNEVCKRLVEKYIRYYRLLAMPVLPNDLKYTLG